MRFYIAARMRIVLVTAALILGGYSAAAAQPAPGGVPHPDIRLMSDVSAIGPDAAAASLGLVIDVPQGWKIYWRTPGAPGLPVSIDWSGSQNLAAADFNWPAPEVLSAAGLSSNGYEGQAIFPITAKLKQPGKTLSLHAALSLSMCSSICVPVNETVEFTVPAGMPEPEANAPLLQSAIESVPVAGRAGYRLESLSPGKSASVLEAVVESPASLEKPTLFIEGDDPEQGFAQIAAEPAPGVAQNAAPYLTHFVLKPVIIGGGDTPEESAKIVRALSGKALTLTLVEHRWGGVRATEFKSAINASGSSGNRLVSGPPLPSEGLAFILLVALLGGFILNFMPCVLPVLSLKLLHVLRESAVQRRHAGLSFLANAAGILTAFIALAALTIGLRAGGNLVDWGWQFQSPVFVGFMIILLLAFAVNMAGLYEISLPRGLLNRVAAAGGSETLPGDFCIGLFAVLLATPCSAPFVGTALAYALSRGPSEILLVFVSMGVGLASPWLLLAAFPRLIVFLPKPGRWMLTLRRILSLALFGTALWLGFVLWQEVAPHSAAGPMAGDSYAANWKPFEQSKIPAMVADGKTVLVDVTAAWCLTCKANEVLVLDRPDVQNLVAQGKLYEMRADWTDMSPAIGAYLARFGRYAIPFNVVYGPGAPDGLLLPELLDTGAVMNAIAQASEKGLPDHADMPK